MGMGLRQKERRNRLPDVGWPSNLPQFPGARTDHVRIESSSRCFPKAEANHLVKVIRLCLRS